MLKKFILIACALALGLTPAVAQEEPPPMGPGIFIPAPEDFAPPPPEDGYEAFEEAFFAAVAGDDGVLTLEELTALLPPPDEMPPPPAEGEEPPKGMMIPLPEDFTPPPPEDGPEAFMEAAFAVIAGDDLELTLEEFMTALPDPEEMPPPEGEEPPPPADEPPPPPPMDGPLHLFIPLPEGFEPPDMGDHEAFMEAAFSAITGGDMELTFDELMALLPEEPPPPPEEGEMMPMGLGIPLPEDWHPPEGTSREVFVETAFGMIAGEDAILTFEELKDWMSRFGLMDGPMEGGGDGEATGISEGDEGLEGLPYPPECDEDVRDSELLPQDTEVACGHSESVGNLLFRTVCNVDPYNGNAISLPESRAADCFGIEAIKGHNIVFEIIKEADGTLMFDTSMGKTAFDTLVLVGEPGGTVYRINLLSADEADARVTIRFIDHPTF